MTLHITMYDVPHKERKVIAFFFKLIEIMNDIYSDCTRETEAIIIPNTNEYDGKLSSPSHLPIFELGPI